MSASDKHFEAFADHTLLKHAILRAYLQRWAFKVVEWGKTGTSLYFVDGFAGAGCDAQGNPGSPVIACRVGEQVRTHFAPRPGRQQARLSVIAVEAVPSIYANLVACLAPFTAADARSVSTYEGTISKHIDAIAAEIQLAPTLYFLDPFGVVGLESSTYPKMLAGGHNEILALFHDVGAARLRGVVHAGSDVETQLEELRNSPSLFPEHDRTEAERLIAEAGRKRAVIELYTPSARAAITGALGESDWVSDLQDLSKDEARDELIVRFMRRLVVSGARFVQVVPMHAETGGHKYCLVHASKSQAGFSAFKEAVSTSLNKDEFSQTMCERMRQDLEVPIGQILGLIQQRFGGQKVEWSQQPQQGGISVKGFLLTESYVFPFQCEDIKRELRLRGWLGRANRIEVCDVPSP